MLIGLIIGAALLIAAAFLLWPAEPDPYALLQKAQSPVAQNLCRLAILEQEPDNEAVWTELLAQYQQYADPLTLYAAQQKAQQALGKPVLLTEEVSARPAVSEPLVEGSTLAQRGRRLTDFKDADGLAAGDTVTYLSTAEGIYACYEGLRLKISGAKAQVMIAAREGLYYLNLLEKKVQYIRGDGLWVTTLSPLDTLDFTFCNGQLYQLDTAGRLYRDGTLLEGMEWAELCSLNGTVYGVCTQGLCDVEKRTVLTSSSLQGLCAGEDGCLYYLNEYRYPCRYDPVDGQAVILREQEAVAVGQGYYMDPKGKIRKL